MMSELEKLKAELEQYVREHCPDEPRVLVHGEGEIGSRVMLVGEAPGEQEEKLRRPFVGKAGRNLDEFLTLAGLNRDELYVTNTVKFRPTRISAAGRVVNRPPTRDEVRLFLPFLKWEITLVKPRVVVTLGNVPLNALSERRCVIGDVHGQLQQTALALLYPMYHPASLIYKPSLREVYAQDIHSLADWLAAHSG